MKGFYYYRKSDIKCGIKLSPNQLPTTTCQPLTISITTPTLPLHLPIPTYTKRTLTSGNLTILTFVWNTSGFAKGNYTIIAAAGAVLGETHIVDNNCTNGTMHVGIPGDVDGNHIVNMLDLYKIALHFGAARGRPNYAPEYNIEDNGIINTLDLYVTAMHFGQTDAQQLLLGIELTFKNVIYGWHQQCVR